MFIGKGNLAIGGRLFKIATTFIGKGSSAIGRLFKIARAKLYYC